MDLDKFHAAVSRVRAEQFFQQKTASAPAVSAVELASTLQKVAEPPPPKGVSLKKWDKILGGKTA